MRLLSGTVACARTLLARPSAALPLPAPRLFARASSSSSTSATESLPRASSSSRTSATESLVNALNTTLYTSVSPDAARAASTAEVRAEQNFAARALRGMPVPPKPTTTGRALVDSQGSVAAMFKQLSVALIRNNVRRELQLGERYEKPNQMRRRKRSERHRRRFKDLVRQKVQLAMRLKESGA